jgi:MinD superfamily P-loop ATPase
MRVAIASGKGGTGKTMVAVNLAKVAGVVTLADCDVEEPNCHLFLGIAPGKVQEVTRKVPAPVPERCLGCGACVAHCRFQALALVKRRVVVFPELCHGCGACTLVCPAHALVEQECRLGWVEVSSAPPLGFIQGRLEVGQPTAPPLIRAVLALLPDGTSAILDGPPGTSCAMVATVRSADLVLLVTEPTPFGRHDLGLAVETLRRLELPMAVLVNRAVDEDRCIQDFCAAEAIPILAEIPEDRRIAEAYARGRPLVEALPGYRPLFERLWRRINLSPTTHTIGTSS